ncbi:3-methyl-2-oxobutanoate hydroxymethyltransferase [Lentisphaera profundi]|uniref:3-methyl-2-oxobutanoate hydroxymethyltransferase n=1 Tax=Lentisphaera profundi TaxID=1658616 RepID=A0ABY7VSZ8_9BACT|nr:3-methyl-2-oxobutanoate hydroxymethyltransferase [Lentisphaera profundi]WDE96847.1 3-methyl-2-oxobutanoate hydroxymethyltransferase [Lentisphaera profundi]
MMRNTVSDIWKLYKKGEKIACVTAYDSTSALLADRAAVDLLLVGDSLGMTVLGHDTTIPVSIDDCLRHSAAVVRGSEKALVVADMPFMSYHGSSHEALKNASRFMQESLVSAVKIEGGEEVADLVKKMVQGGIPVMGHIGLLPQAVLVKGGYKVRGRTEEDEQQLLKDGLALQAAGAFAIVMECVKSDAAKRIVTALDIPIIGIGSGLGCDGEVQVMHDILGLNPDFIPRHAKKYLDLAEQINGAFTQYKDDVKSDRFPTQENWY